MFIYRYTITNVLVALIKKCKSTINAKCCVEMATLKLSLSLSLSLSTTFSARATVVTTCVISQHFLTVQLEDSSHKKTFDSHTQALR